MTGFIDGNAICADCALCCAAHGLLLTPEELDRLPRLKPFVRHFDGHFYDVDTPDGCPYLSEDKSCGTFETRPFDCSLYPVCITEVRRRPGQPAAEATWIWGGLRCPRRETFIRRGVTAEQQASFREWLAGALKAEQVTLREANLRYHLEQAGKSLLRAARSLFPARHG